MNIKIFSTLLIIFMATLVLATSMNAKISLNNVSADLDASASSRISVREDRRAEGDKVNIRIQMKKLDNIPGRVFEGWLVDEDSGYKLSLGTFKSRSRGRARFNFKQVLGNFGIYDKLAITSEPVRDTNPNPDMPVFVAAIPASLAGNIDLSAELEADQEVPSTFSNSEGSASFVLDPDANTLSYNIGFKNLEGNETGAHIHGFSNRNTESGVLLTLPLGDPKIGVWHYDESQEADILAGMTYVNIHSDLYPGGEIRGQIEVI